MSFSVSELSVWLIPLSWLSSNLSLHGFQCRDPLGSHAGSLSVHINIYWAPLCQALKMQKWINHHPCLWRILFSALQSGATEVPGQTEHQGGWQQQMQHRDPGGWTQTCLLSLGMRRLLIAYVFRALDTWETTRLWLVGAEIGATLSRDLRTKALKSQHQGKMFFSINQTWEYL